MNPNPIFDKKGFWLAVVDGLADQLDPGFYFMLRNNTYLDRVENGEAVIVVGSESLQRLCEKKYTRMITKALEEETNQDVVISFVYGPSRMIEKARKEPLPGDNEDGISKEKELAMLHDQYGDIMSIVDNHPAFRKASLPLTAGGWGIFPQILTNACKDHGVLAVLSGLRQTTNKTSLRNARGYFLASLERGDFGEKLTRGADSLGLRHEGKLLSEKNDWK